MCEAEAYKFFTKWLKSLVGSAYQAKPPFFLHNISLGTVKFRCVENHSKDFIDFRRQRIVKPLMARRWPMPWVSADLVLWRRGDFWGLAGFTSRRGFTGHGFLVEPNNSESFPWEADKEAAKEIDLAEAFCTQNASDFFSSFVNVDTPVEATQGRVLFVALSESTRVWQYSYCGWSSRQT